MAYMERSRRHYSSPKKSLGAKRPTEHSSSAARHTGCKDCVSQALLSVGHCTEFLNAIEEASQGTELETGPEACIVEINQKKNT